MRASQAVFSFSRRWQCVRQARSGLQATGPAHSSNAMQQSAQDSHVRLPTIKSCAMAVVPLTASPNSPNFEAGSFASCQRIILRRKVADGSGSSAAGRLGGIQRPPAGPLPVAWLMVMGQAGSAACHSAALGPGARGLVSQRAGLGGLLERGDGVALIQEKLVGARSAASGPCAAKLPAIGPARGSGPNPKASIINPNRRPPNQTLQTKLHSQTFQRMHADSHPRHPRSSADGTANSMG